MRPPIVMAKPNYPPHVCINCGVQDGRLWFVDLGMDLDFYFNPLNNGNVFFCNECWDSYVKDIAKLSQVFVNQVLPWDSGSYVEPTYTDASELEGFSPVDEPIEMIPLLTLENPNTPVGNPEGGFHFGPRLLGGSDSEPEDSDRPTTDDVEPVAVSNSNDDVSESTSGVQEFQQFFGRTGN